MKEKLRQVVNNTDNETKDIPFARYYIFVEKSSCEYSILNCSDSYKDICDAYKSCESVYADFVPFIYDYDKDKLLDYGEEPDKEGTIDYLDCEVEVDGVGYEYVEHPSHYGGDTTYECIKVIEAWGLDKNFDLGTAIRYICRAGNKPENPTLQDLKKAAWYLQREIDKLEKMNDKD